MSRAVVIATGVRADGWREVFGYAVGDSEDGGLWTACRRFLEARGLGGVQIWSTNSSARLNKEVKRRTDVVGVFPNSAVLLRPAGAVLVEGHDERQGHRPPLPLRSHHGPTRQPTTAGRGSAARTDDGMN